jgi:alkyl hydroperoxide reductase subunit AhpC
MTYVNAQAEAFAHEGAALMVVLSDISLFQLAQYEDIRPFTVPLLTDSLNRMHRSYGVALTPPSATAVTFLIDPLRVLRFHIAQDLALWNLDNLHGLLRTKRHVVSNPPQWVTVASARALVSVGMPTILW